MKDVHSWQILIDIGCSIHSGSGMGVSRIRLFPRCKAPCLLGWLVSYAARLCFLPSTTMTTTSWQHINTRVIHGLPTSGSPHTMRNKHPGHPRTHVDIHHSRVYDTRMMRRPAVSSSPPSPPPIYFPPCVRAHVPVACTFVPE